jgi:hypothetical protein
MMYLFCREASGDGGYQTESGHYYEDAIDGPNRYAVAFRTMFGRDISSFDDIRAFIPRMISSRIYDANGKSWGQSISSSFAPHGALVAPAYPIARDDLKPVVLYHWNAFVGGSVDNPDINRLVAAAPVQTFLHYPVGMKPQPPSACMPLHWQATTFGYYNFRNGWKGSDDIVLQVLAKSKTPGGWGGPDAGTFRLDGFGKSWAVGNTGREVRRYLENAVDTTDGPPLTESGLGRVTNKHAEADGSGGLSIDLTNLMYDAVKRGGPGAERYGSIPIPATQTPLGENFRAYAVDYSDKSGAPCLLAIVDRMTGPNGKRWFWQLPSTADTKTDAHGFTITQGAATLRAVFAAPAQPQLEAGRLSFKTKKGAGSAAGSIITLTTRAVTAVGADPKDGVFFLVATLQQEGAAPEIAVEGTGLDAKVTVGKRMVTFDGTKIVITDK